MTLGKALLWTALVLFGAPVVKWLGDAAVYWIVGGTP